MSLTTFVDWLSSKRISESDLTDMSNVSSCEDYDNISKEITSLLMSKYHHDFLNFIKKLSEQNKDEELSNLIRKISSSTPDDMPKLNYTMDKDQIVQPTSDRGIDPNSVDG